MSEEQPALGEEFEIDWPDGMDSQDRIDNIAQTLRQPRSAEWVSQRADVSVETTRKHLEQLVERGEFDTTRFNDSEDTRYYPDPERQLIDRINELAGNSTDQLTQLQIETADEIESFQDEFGVDSPTDLRRSIDETLSADERRRRAKIAHRWEKNQHFLSLLDVALALRSHKEEYSTSIDDEV